jgi:hypothetical protein
MFIVLVVLGGAVAAAVVYTVGHKQGQSVQASLIAGYLKAKAVAVPEFEKVVATVKADTAVAVAKIKSLL